MSVFIIYMLLGGLLVLCAVGLAIAEIAMDVYGPIRSDDSYRIRDNPDDFL